MLQWFFWIASSTVHENYLILQMDLKGIDYLRFFGWKYVNPRFGVEHGPSYPPCWLIEFWRSCGLRNSSCVPLFHATFWFIRWSWVAGWWFGIFFRGVETINQVVTPCWKPFVWNPTIWFFAFSSFLGYTAIIRGSLGVDPPKKAFLDVGCIASPAFCCRIRVRHFAFPWALGDEWPVGWD